MIIWVTLTESSAMIFFPSTEVQFSYSFVLINNPARAKALVHHLFFAARKIIWRTLYLLLYCQRNYTQEMEKQGKTDCPFCKSIGESLFVLFSLYKAYIKFHLSSLWTKTQSLDDQMGDFNKQISYKLPTHLEKEKSLPGLFSFLSDIRVV